MDTTAGEWPEIRAWRKATRKTLVAARTAVGEGERDLVQRHVGSLLADRIAADMRTGRPSAVAFYWPIHGEIALFDAVRAAIALGARAALPFIPAPDTALVFRAWAPGMRVVRGIWNIPTPERDEQIAPSIVLVPVVGFDDAGHRLGNGGGFYDRTFAALPPSTLRVGIGFECLRLPTIHPQPHDLPMHWLVTERGAAAVTDVT